VIIDDKGGEVMHKDSEKIANERTLTYGEKYDKERGSIKI
jgi:hypothetical protein